MRCSIIGTGRSIGVKKQDKHPSAADKRLFQADERLRNFVIMLIAVLFILGIGNFALHKAVLESDHPMLKSSPWFVHLLGGRISLLAEFLILLAAMLLTASGWTASAWVYLGYSLLNGLSAWLILTGRV